jgi:hypothetical protein
VSISIRLRNELTGTELQNIAPQLKNLGLKQEDMDLEEKAPTADDNNDSGGTDRSLMVLIHEDAESSDELLYDYNQEIYTLRIFPASTKKYLIIQKNDIKKPIAVFELNVYTFDQLKAIFSDSVKLSEESDLYNLQEVDGIKKLKYRSGLVNRIKDYNDHNKEHTIVFSHTEQPDVGGSNYQDQAPTLSNKELSKPPENKSHPVQNPNTKSFKPLKYIKRKAGVVRDGFMSSLGSIANGLGSMGNLFLGAHGGKKARRLNHKIRY